MKRYSIASSSSRRKSVKEDLRETHSASQSATLELERLEQEITITLQEIDKNLSKSNAIINDKIYPVLKNYGKSSAKVWNNVNFWKYFMEQAANVELTGYEELVNPNPTDSNTLNNSKSSKILLDDDIQTATDVVAVGSVPHVGSVHGVAAASSGTVNFKKPILNKVLQNVEETPTWSEDIRHQPGKINASTPQSRRNMGGGVTVTSNAPTKDTRYDSSDSIRLQPPTTITQIESPKITHTIRQSLDNFHKVSISPRKKTPSKEDNRRSSIIQNLIDSSPTLPEPPVLLSQMTNTDANKLSPINLNLNLSPQSERGSSRSSRASLQRFPLTPKYSRLSGTPRKSPSHSSKEHQAPVIESSSDPMTTNEEIPQPELVTIDLLKKRKSSIVDDDTTTKTNNKRILPNDDDEENVFLDNSARIAPGATAGESATSTIYHSVIRQGSRENTNISTLFQEVLENSNISKENEEENEEIANRANDLFGEIIPREDDLTGNSTGDMGSFLGERFKKITRNE